MDTRFLSKEFVTDFIKLYEKFPCLWKVKSKEYLNKHVKNDAYERLIHFCRKTYPEADLKFVKHKIQSMRNSFRKEQRKVIASKRNSTGTDVYEPSLWYYKLLLFTKDQELHEETADVEDGAEEDNYQELEECSRVVKHENPSPTAISPHQRSINIMKPVAKKRRHNIEQKFFNRCISALRTENTIDEFDIVGKNVAAKLRQMEFRQRVLAESLIHQVLTKGLFREISRNTVLEESPCALYNAAYSLPATSCTSTPLASPIESNNEQDTNSGHAVLTTYDSGGKSVESID